MATATDDPHDEDEDDDDLQESELPDFGEVADKLLRADISNIIRKLKAGRTLNTIEEKRLRTYRDKLRKDGERKAEYVTQKNVLAERLGLSRPTLDKRMESVHFPEREDAGWDVAACRAYLAKLEAGQAVVNMPKANPDDMGFQPGAEFALTRLAEAERQAAADFYVAYQSGDAESINLTLETWLALCNRLKEFEKIVAQDRREAGELVPRNQVEAFLAYVGQAHGYGEEQYLNVVAKNIAECDNPTKPREIRQAVKGVLYREMSASLNACVDEGKLIRWMAEAYAKGFRP